MIGTIIPTPTSTPFSAEPVTLYGKRDILDVIKFTDFNGEISLDYLDGISLITPSLKAQDFCLWYGRRCNGGGGSEREM